MTTVATKVADYVQRRRDRVVDVLTRAGREGRTAAQLASEFVWPLDSMRAVLVDLLDRGDIIVHPDDDERAETQRFIAVAFEKGAS